MRDEIPVVTAGFPFADTQAAIMLRDGLWRAKAERKLSLRKISVQLGYKQPAVLSQAATGRVPVPLDRAMDIARAVGMDPAKFLIAALAQKEPDAERVLQPVNDNSPHIDSFMRELLALAGAPLDKLPEENKAILRQVITDRAPGRRWLALGEIPTVVAIRDTVPGFAVHGLEPSELEAVTGLLEELTQLYDK